MAVKRARSERLLEDALSALNTALTASRAPWMIIGGIALIARGVRPFTTDIDAAVRGDAITVESLLALYPKLDTDRARRSVVELATLAEAPELVAGFDQAVARALTLIRPARKRPPPRKE